ncbi:unnamed protein product [Ixodes persulcatus]
MRKNCGKRRLAEPGKLPRCPQFDCDFDLERATSPTPAVPLTVASPSCRFTAARSRKTQSGAELNVARPPNAFHLTIPVGLQGTLFSRSLSWKQKRDSSTFVLSQLAPNL